MEAEKVRFGCYALLFVLVAMFATLLSGYMSLDENLQCLYFPDEQKAKFMAYGAAMLEAEKSAYNMSEAFESVYLFGMLKYASLFSNLGIAIATASIQALCACFGGMLFYFLYIAMDCLYMFSKGGHACRDLD